MPGTQSRLGWPLVSSDAWRDMRSTNGSDEGQRRRWVPAATVSESDTDFRVRLDLPGVGAEGLDVDLDADRLSISGERAAPVDQAQEKALVAEAPWGRFERRFRLGPDLDRDAIEASFRDGVLEVRVPKRDEARPRRIPVSTEA